MTKQGEPRNESLDELPSKENQHDQTRRTQKNKRTKRTSVTKLENSKTECHLTTIILIAHGLIDFCTPCSQFWHTMLAITKHCQHSQATRSHTFPLIPHNQFAPTSFLCSVSDGKLNSEIANAEHFPFFLQVKTLLISLLVGHSQTFSFGILLGMKHSCKMLPTVSSVKTSSKDLHLPLVSARVFAVKL